MTQNNTQGGPNPVRPPAQRGTRRGVILIFVIVLLVLLSIMTTAYLATVRLDRQQLTGIGGAATVGVPTFGIQDTTWLDQTFNLLQTDVEQSLIDSLFRDPGFYLQFRQPFYDSVNQPSLRYTGYDGPGGKDSSTGLIPNWYLAARFPLQMQNPAVVVTPNPTAEAPRWPVIAQWPTMSFNGVALTGFADPRNPPDDNASLQYTRTTWLKADSVTQSYVAGIAAQGVTPDAQNPRTRLYPALTDDTDPSNIHTYIAADADGDGIADSGLVQLPLGVDAGVPIWTNIYGIRYYGAVKVEDNTGAINFNTALSVESDYDLAGNLLPNYGFFRSNIGLVELFSPGAAQLAIAAGLPTESQTLLRSRLGNQPTVNTPPIDDTDSARADFVFTSIGDALDMQIARRLLNPGANTPENRFASILDNGSLRTLPYRMTLLSPSLNQTPIESLLASSLYVAAPNYAVDTARRFGFYPADSYDPIVGGWSGTPTEHWYQYNYAFDFDPATTFAPTLTPNWTDPGGSPVGGHFRSIRPLLTGYNPVANAMPIHFETDASVPQAERQGPMMPDALTLAGASYPTPLPPSNPSYPLGALTDLPNKISINTDPFAQLWLGFLSAMADTRYASGSSPPMVLSTPFGTTDSVTNPVSPNSLAATTDLYSGSKFDPTTFAATGAIDPYHMFRSSIRDPEAQPLPSPPTQAYFSPNNMMLLRSALAAVNAEALRNSNVPGIPFHDIALTAKMNAGGTMTDTPVTVRVYGVKRPPFMTEVYANTDTVANPYGTGPNTVGYVAVELYNPYNVAIDLQATAYKLATLDRVPGASAGKFPSFTPTLLFDFATAPAGSATIQPGGYMLLENYHENASAMPVDPANQAMYRPLSSGLPSNSDIPARNVGQPPLTVFYVPRLATAVNTELVLMCPPNAAAPPNPTGTPPNAGLSAYVPCDSFDFTGLEAGTPTTANVWYYARINDPAPYGSTVNASWRFVYPGRYDGSLTSRRQQGTYELGIWNPSTNSEPGWLAPNPPSFGTTGGTSSPTSNGNVAATYPRTFPIQLYNTDFPGPNALVGPAPYKFPFGGFARDGDILQVPFIGAYRVMGYGADNDAGTPDDTLIELNSVTMDASFAEDTDTADDPPATTVNANFIPEQIGRFCPVGDPVGVPPTIDYFDYPIGAVPADPYRYRWAGNLLDYFSVHNPQDDYFPAVPEPSQYASRTGQPRPQPVPNGPISDPMLANDPLDPLPPDLPIPDTERKVPIQGLLGINSAPWQALSMLPLVIDPASGRVDLGVDPVSGSTYRLLNMDLAKAIAYYRDVDDGVHTPPQPHGPFRNIFELNKVFDVQAYRANDATGLTRTFANGWGTLTFDNSPTNDPGNNEGDLSPWTPSAATVGSDGVRNDFEERFLQVNRLSNLITTRSDTFTCYVLVQAWQPWPTATDPPRLVGERRAAFIVDRSTITKAAHNLASLLISSVGSQ